MKNAKTIQQIKPISSYSSVHPWFSLLFRFRTAKKGWKLIYTVLWDFFILQTLQKFKITKRPVIFVDTDLDKKIPFVPSKVKTYINFIPYFLKPTVMLTKRMGYKNASPYLNEYIDFISKMYKNAATIYRFCMTTTNRPNYKVGKEFKTIHAADPHLLCVPSLHVTIAAGTYAWFKNFFKLNLFDKNETKFYENELLQEGIKITESVLFVKQHSVNCIPIALYMLSSTMNKNFFSVHEADFFMSSLFNNCTEISLETRKEIQEYFKYMYERSFLEHIYENEWQECIKNWLIEHARNTNQNPEVLEKRL